MSACRSFFGRVCDKCSGRGQGEDEDWRRSVNMANIGVVNRRSSGGDGAINRRGSTGRTVFGEVRPPPREQAEWQGVCPVGGGLLKLQVCIAAEGEEGSDWFLGRLFIAELGLLVESNDGPGGEENYSSGLVKWEDITSLSTDHSTRSKKNEVLLSQDSFKLRIQLGSPFAVEWLQETYQASTAPVERWFSFGSSFSDDGDDLRGGASKVTVQTQWHPGHPAFDQTDAKLPDGISMIPQAEAKEKTLYSSVIPQIKLDEIAAVMQKEEWPFIELLHDMLKCREIALAPWKESARFPANQIRCCQYTLPIPKNPAIPDGITKLIGVPEFARCMSHYRLQVDPDQITMLMQSGSRGVKHGDSLCIEALCIWRQRGEDVVFSEYLHLNWLENLAFYARPAKPFIEGQSKEDALKVAKFLDQVIVQDVQKLRKDRTAAARSAAAAAAAAAAADEPAAEAS